MLSSGSPPGAPEAGAAPVEPAAPAPQPPSRAPLGATERKLQASLLSIKMFWAPELERERKARLGEKTRAEKAESVLKSQLEKGVRYMQKLVHLEAAYEELEIGAQKQARLEAELRASLEAQLKEKLNQDGGGGGGGGGGGPDLGPKVAAQTYEIQRLQKELTDASDQVTMLRRTLETTEAVAAKATEAQRAAESERRQSQAQGQKIKLLTAQLSAMTSQRDKQAQLATGLEAHIAEAAAARAAAEGSVTSLELELAAARTEVAELGTSAAAAAAAAAMAKAEIEAVRGEAQKLREADVAKSAGLRKAQDELAAEKQRAEDKAKELAAATAVAEAAAATQEMLKREHEAAMDVEHSRRGVLENEVDTLCDRLASLEADWEAERESVAADRAEWATKLKVSEDAYQAKITELVGTVTGLEAQLVQRGEEIAAVTAELAASAATREGTQAELQGQLARVEAELLEAQKGAKAARRAQKIAEATVQERAKGSTELEAELQKYKTKSASSSKKATAALAKAAAAQKAEATATEDLKAATTDLEAARASLAAAESTASTQIAAATAEIEALKAELAQTRTAHAEVVAGLEARAAAADAATEAAVNDTAAAAAAAAKEAELEGALRELQGQLTAAEAEVDRLSEANTRGAAALEAERASHAAALASSTAAQTSHQELAAEKEALAKRGKKLASERDEFKKALEAEKERIAGLEATLAAKEEEVALVRAEVARGRQELSETKATLTRSIREVEEKVMSDRTTELLEVVSRMDQKIAALEAEGAKKNREQIEALIQERLVHVDKLKQQFDKQAELLDKSSRLSETTFDPAALAAAATPGNDQASAGHTELLAEIELRHEDCARMRVYVNQLIAEVQKQDEGIRGLILEGLPDVGLDAADVDFGSKSKEELKGLHRVYEEEAPVLEEMVDSLLNRIVEHCPQLLETLQAAL